MYFQYTLAQIQVSPSTLMTAGIKSASEMFQQNNSETFGNITSIHIIADDMIIAIQVEYDQRY